MDSNVPYMPSNKNLHGILDAMQNAAVPETFSYEFLKDLGFASSNDRAIRKMLIFLGFLDPSGTPRQSYREFVDHNKTKTVLASRLRAAYDDLYQSNRTAHERPVETLRGWFKSKTGKGDSVAEKMASTFKSLASYADFSTDGGSGEKKDEALKETKTVQENVDHGGAAEGVGGQLEFGKNLGLVYRLEIHLPDTPNIETYRSIFRALREELS